MTFEHTTTTTASDFGQLQLEVTEEAILAAALQEFQWVFPPFSIFRPRFAPNKNATGHGT